MSGKIIVELTDEQIRTYRKARRKLALTDTFIQTVIDGILERMIDDEDEFWRQVHELTGTTEYTHDLTIKLMSRQIVATPRVKEKE